MYISLWLYKQWVPIPPPLFLSFCKHSNETLLSCTCYWEWGLVWVIWPTSSWTKLFASPHVGAIHLNIDVIGLYKAARRASWTSYGWPRDTGKNLQHNTERSYRCRKLCVPGLLVEERKAGGEHMGCVPSTQSSQAASGDLKGWDQPQKLLSASSVEVQDYAKSNFQLQ